MVAFNTVLKKRKNRETSISYGIGHGGFEVILILGITYIQYIAYAVMIHTGTFGTLVEQVAVQAPEQAERVFAVFFHIGASILVFYACKDKKHFWLYPLAIILHTGMDFIGGLYIFNVISLSPWMLEGIVSVFGLAVFFGSYLLFYKKDVGVLTKED